jgi:hypothetical protein
MTKLDHAVGAHLVVGRGSSGDQHLCLSHPGMVFGQPKTPRPPHVPLLIPPALPSTLVDAVVVRDEVGANGPRGLEMFTTRVFLVSINTGRSLARTTRSRQAPLSAERFN